MKYVLLILLGSLLSQGIAAQKIETAKSGDEVKIVISGDYMVQRDTSESGVILLTLIPSAALQKDLESRLGSVEAELERVSVQEDELNARKKALHQEQKELTALLEGGKKPVKAVRSITKPSKQ